MDEAGSVGDTDGAVDADGVDAGRGILIRWA